MLIILTVILCFAAYLLKIHPYIILFAYTIALAMIKGLLSDSIKDVFNLEPTIVKYRKVGFADSVISFVSIGLMTAFYTYMVNNTEPIIILISIIMVILVYRFLLWDISQVLRKLYSRN